MLIYFLVISGTFWSFLVTSGVKVQVDMPLGFVSNSNLADLSGNFFSYFLYLYKS